MPIYEYTCRKCEETFEALIRGGEKPSCPLCGSEDVKRLLSACGFVSKGSGGETTSRPAGSSCGGCTSSSCGGCGV
ncbi:MAG TPA: zinc ribbon domain-containing protein [Desulfosalsimonadaceae bacterium]|nr:zinc ribbon domain-containing protein [Desulfosalsimonadaceae bacterium]